MNPLQRMGAYFLLCTLGGFSYTLPAFSQTAPAAAAQSANTERDGQRLYNLQAHQWSIYFTKSGGTLSLPAVGEFKNGRAEFYDQETINDRAILLRFSVSDITPNSCHFEQAFSDDGGKTWEANFIVTETLVKDESDKPH